MVKRMPGNIHSGYRETVLASDYDALAAELAALKVEQREFLAEHARRGLRHEARVQALEAELERVRQLSIWGTAIPVGPTYDRLQALTAALRSVPRYAFPGQEEFWAKIDALLGDAAEPSGGDL